MVQASNLPSPFPLISLLQLVSAPAQRYVIKFQNIEFPSLCVEFFFLRAYILPTISFLLNKPLPQFLVRQQTVVVTEFTNFVAHEHSWYANLLGELSAPKDVCTSLQLAVYLIRM